MRGSRCTLVALLLVFFLGITAKAAEVTAWPFCRVAAGDSRGSGTLVDVVGGRGLIITCEHVVRGSSSVSVSFLRGETCGGTVVATNKGNDLAAIVVQGQLPKPIMSAAFRGEQSYTISGFGSGDFRQTSGRLAGISSASPGATHRWATLATNVRPGDSGAGIMDEQGMFVGGVWGHAADGW